MDDDVLTITAISEPEPGEKLRELFEEYWPAYRRWMRRAEPVGADTAAAQLRAHMPELYPVYERLCGLAGGGEEASRFLSLYNPPRLVRGCTQAVLDTPDGPVLLRNYDHSPDLFDGVLLRSEWNGVATLATTDCIWGALDGVNARGLAVALAFGGRNAVGPGFAAPLIVRYLLETCATAAEASVALRRLPVYMPYIFVVVDAAGDHKTAHLSPDRPAIFRRARASTNHHCKSDWPEYAAFSASVPRLERIERVVARGAGFDETLGAFLSPPIWRTQYAKGAGTLYTAAYRPATGELGLHWPTADERFSVLAFDERTISVRLRGAAVGEGPRR